MIRLEHVKKTFDGKILYDDLNLTIEDGQFVVPDQVAAEKRHS
jgi:ABC-type sugar transport system ATPase subunit